MCRLWNIFIKHITNRDGDFPMSLDFFRNNIWVLVSRRLDKQGNKQVITFHGAYHWRSCFTNGCSGNLACMEKDIKATRELKRAYLL